VLHLLTECDVQVLEIRRCHEPSRRVRPEPVQQESPPAATEDPAPTPAGVVIPFPRRPTARPQQVDPAPGESPSTEPGL